MEAGGRDHDNGVDVGIGESVVPVGIGAGSSEVCGRCSARLLCRVANRKETGARNPARIALCVDPAGAAASDYADIQHFDPFPSCNLNHVLL